MNAGEEVSRGLPAMVGVCNRRAGIPLADAGQRMSRRSSPRKHSAGRGGQEISSGLTYHLGADR